MTATTSSSNRPRVAIFGATGFTGRVVLAELLARGHEVHALVRRPEALAAEAREPGLTIVQGDALDAQDIARCLDGADAVVHCLGVGGKGDGKPSSLVSDSVRAVTEQMERRGIQRIVCMSNIGAGGSGKRWVNSLVIPIFFRWLIPIVEDKNRMEDALRGTELDWVSVRLPNIVDGDPRPVQVSADGRSNSLTITTGSVAQYLADQVVTRSFDRRMPSVSN